MKRFVITEEEKRSILSMYLSEQIPTGSTVTQTGSTVNRQSNRPPCVSGQLIELGCWLDEIDKVQREIGNPSGWTMDDYNRLQKTLNDYKTWRTTTPEGQAVKDKSNKPNEYVVQLPPHLQTVNESNFNFDQTNNRLLGDFFTVKNNFQYLTNKDGVEVYVLKRNGFSLVVGTRGSNDPSKVILMIQLRFPQGKSINYLSEVKGMSAVEVGVNDYGRMTELLQGAIDFGKAQSGYDNLPPLPR
jgi:hypothetical protein